MPRPAGPAHAPLGGLWLGCVGWTLTGVALGLVQWRVWLVSQREAVSSGVAWVGLWRACFHSHAAVTPGLRVMHCRDMGLGEAFTPPEVAAGQVLMVLSLLVGLCGNAGAVYALRDVYFGFGKSPRRRRLAFLGTGALSLLASGMALVPLLWNLSSVLTNRTIPFPPDFRLPPEPDAQRVGSGIAVGVVGALLMIASGIFFCCYGTPTSPPPGTPLDRTTGTPQGGAGQPDVPV